MVATRKQSYLVNNNNDSSHRNSAASSSETSENGGGNKFKREIGLFNAVAITVGSIIGSGIFIAPKGIIVHVGSVGLALVMWVLCGIFSILGALCYVELGTMYPTAGGEYTYIFEAFGPLAAFLFIWSRIIIFGPLGNAIIGLAFAKYVVQPFFSPGCNLPDVAIQLLAAVALCFLTFVNCCDISRTRKLLNGFMLLKIAALVAIIVGGIYTFSAGKVQNFDNIWENSNFGAGSLILASFSGSFAFGGWTSLSTMLEELKEPSKNLPRAIIISLTMVTFIYLLANAAYLAVLTPAEIVSSDAVAVTFVEKLVGAWGWIVPLFVSLSIFGTLSIFVLVNSRAAFVGSRCGQLPSFISLLTLSSKSPASAVIFLNMISLLFLFTADVFFLIEFSGIATASFNVVIIAALIYLRWLRPYIERPFKVSLVVAIVYFIMCSAVAVIPVFVEPVKAAIGAILALSGLPVYYLFIGKDKIQWKWIQRFDEQSAKFVQKLLIAVKGDTQ